MLKKLIPFIMVLTIFITTPLTIKAQESDGGVAGNAQIETRAAQDRLPVFFVKGQEIATYEYQGEEVLDFRRYFNVWDQRTDILKMNNRVDGVNIPIDLGGYEWDLSEFNINELGRHTITISYEGISGVIVEASQVVTVIEEDVTAPNLYGFLSTNVIFNVGDKFEVFMSRITAVDNVDGVIALTIDNFSGYEGINDGVRDSVHEVTITVSDKAGNVKTEIITITLKDVSAPVIYDAHNIETRKGKTVDYKAHVYAVDNITARDKIVLEFFIVTDQSGETESDVNEIDFNVVGEYYVKVVATDEAGQRSSAVYRVIVKDGYKLLTIALFVNVGVLVIAGGTFGIVTLVKSSRRKKDVQ